MKTEEPFKIYMSTKCPKELKLVLKKKWFDMIASGKKKEEYRDITQYWERRLYRCNLVGPATSFSIPKAFDIVTFYLGYAKDRPSISFKWKGTSIEGGNQRWGAEPNKKYFVIKLGERV